MNVTRKSFIAGAAAGVAGTLAAAGPVFAAESAQEGAVVPGSYVGTAYGNHGEVYVKVAVGEGGSIDDVELAGHHDTDHVMHDVVQVIPQRIMDAQSTKVDTMAGATMSSNGIIGAVEDALAQAGVNPDELPETTVQSADEELSYDALVVGTGCAGLMAAVTLQGRGVKTLLIDQLDILGGTLRFSGGNMFGTLDPSRRQDLYDLFMKQTTSGITEYDETVFPNMDKVDLFLDSMTEVAQYLSDSYGMGFEYFDAGETKFHIAENDFESVSAVKGYQLAAALNDIFCSLGGTVRLGLKLESIVKGDDGAVSGAVASAKSGTVTINAPYVVICTGSAAANAEAMVRYGAPLRAGDPSTVSRGDDGSGIDAMVEAGAQVIPDWIYSSRSLSVCPELACTAMGQSNGNGKAHKFLVENNYAGKTTLYVNDDAQRLGDESNGNTTLLFCTEDTPDHLFAVMDVDNAAGRCIVGELEEGLASSPSHFFRADSIAELAQAAGLPADELQKTVDRYNELAEKGSDDDFGKAAENLLPVKTAPFYMVCETFVDRDVCGGVFTDADREVLDADGAPIAGLFSAGMCSARDLFANVDPGSCSIGNAVAFGYVAANKIAERLGK